MGEPNKGLCRGARVATLQKKAYAAAGTRGATSSATYSATSRPRATSPVTPPHSPPPPAPWPPGRSFDAVVECWSKRCPHLFPPDLRDGGRLGAGANAGASATVHPMAAATTPG